MGRGRGKVKKSSIIAQDGSGEEEKMPVKRRGRPTKVQKEEVEEEAGKIDDTKVESSLEDGNKKSKPSLKTEESMEIVKDESGVGLERNGDELTKAVGFRHNGSRRKNKPRRAAEVGVSACEVCSWVALRS